MRLLWIATKPPWPPVDGGRLAAALTLEALAAAGLEITVVAAAQGRVAEAPPGVGLVPVPARPTPWTLAAPRAWLAGGSATLERHRCPALAREVERQLGSIRPHVVHVEQLHGLTQAAPAFARGLPVVLRAQNVESDLWSGAAGLASGPRAVWLRAEARRLARAEGEAVTRATVTLALTEEDAARLRLLAGGSGGEVLAVPVPHPAELPANPPVAGEPAVVLLGSGGWLPNRAGATWFLEEVWPRVVARRPGARLHVFGETPPVAGPGIVVHGVPADSAEAFPRGAILAVPLHVASGVRMKILEAWARGLAVVATPAAAAGLAAESGRELLVESSPDAFAEALLTLGSDSGRQASLISAGRRCLVTRHDPASVAGRLAAVYEAARSRVMNSS